MCCPGQQQLQTTADYIAYIQQQIILFMLCCIFIFILSEHFVRILYSNIVAYFKIACVPDRFVLVATNQHGDGMMALSDWHPGYI